MTGASGVGKSYLVRPWASSVHDGISYDLCQHRSFIKKAKAQQGRWNLFKRTGKAPKGRSAYLG